MTLKKGHPLPLLKPGSMQKTLSAVEDGHRYLKDIIRVTGLLRGQVRSALANLVYTKQLVRVADKQQRSVYLTPGEWNEVAEPDNPFRGVAPPCLCGVRSIFDVKIVRTDLPCFTTSDNKKNEHP